MAEWNASGYQSVSSLQEMITTEQLSRLTLGECARYQMIAADNPTENNTFKFDQMEVVLTPLQQHA